MKSFLAGDSLLEVQANPGREFDIRARTLYCSDSYLPAET
jgi:hypothetical protein